jgi:hypothetical protein
MSDQALLRILPLVTTAAVEASVAEDFDRFRSEVGGGDECIAVTSPSGSCIWSSVETFRAGVTCDDDVKSLQLQMLQVLNGGCSNDVAMGEG